MMLLLLFFILRGSKVHSALFISLLYILELGRAQVYRARAELELTDSGRGLIEPCQRPFKSFRAQQFHIVNVQGKARSSF